MIKSSLIEILRSFSSKELREFQKWLKSPAHNQREDVSKLLDYLLEDKHLYKNEFLIKETVYPWVYSKKEAYDDGKMRQIMFFMTKALEDYLVYKELLGNELLSKIALASCYRKRKLDKAYRKSFKVVNNLLENSTFKNRDYLRNVYQFQNERYLYQSEKSRSDTVNLQEASDALDVMYLADKLRQSCFILAHQKVRKTEYEIGLLEEVLKFVEKGDFLKNPAIAIYYYDYKSKIEPDNESHFKNLKKEIKENGHFFPLNEKRDIFMLAINYCIGKMNNGVEKYIREAFELYKEAFDQGALIQDNRLSRYSFRNAFTIGLKLEEFDWLESFLKKYQKYLKEEYRESIVHFSYSMLHFVKKEYDLAKEHLIQVDYTDILINLNAKTILLKIYFIEGEFNSLDSLLESMRNYLQRKKVIGYHKANYKNIIRFTKRLLRVNSKMQKQKLALEIENANPLSEKNWLLEQLQ